MDAGEMEDVRAAAAAEEVISSRGGSVLGKKTILKSDHFPGCQNKRLTPQIDGAPNYRQVRCFFFFFLSSAGVSPGTGPPDYRLLVSERFAERLPLLLMGWVGTGAMPDQ
jgi:hypothetical protein